MTHIQFRTHPTSGERYIVEVSDEPELAILRAVGPCRIVDGVMCDPLTDAPLTESAMRDWLDNAGQDAIDDGVWLAGQLAS